MAVQDDLAARTEAIKASMDAGQWEKAIESLTELRQQQLKEGAKPERLATVDYHLGMCQMQQATEQKKAKREQAAAELYLEALRSFESSRKVTDEQGNSYYNMALWRLGIVYQAQQKYAEALECYEGFLKHRNQLRDSYDQGSFMANMIICYCRQPSPDLTRAAEKMADMIERKAFWGVKDEVLVNTLSVYGKKAIEHGEVQSLKGWLAEGKIQLSESVNGRALARLVDLAMKALDAGELELAKGLFHLLPRAEEQVAEHPAQSLLLLVNKDAAESENVWFSASVLWAGILAREGRVDESIAVLKDLLDNKSYSGPRTAAYLALARVDAKSGNEAVAMKWLQTAAEEKGISADKIESIEMAKLALAFQLKKYAFVIQAVREGGKKNEGMLFMAATAAFQMNDEREYQHWVQLYKQTFPDGAHIRDLQFYWAAMQVSESRWLEAEKLLAEMLADKGMDAELRNAAEYQLAAIDFSLARYDVALKRLESLSDAKAMDDKQRLDVWLLSGQVLEITRQRERAKIEYEKALQLAEKKALDDRGAEALFYLVAFHGREMIGGDTNLEIAQAIPYYERFMKKYSGSVYAAQTITAAMPAMVAASRGDEIFATAEAKIMELTGTKDAPGLEALISTYLWEKLESGEKLHDLTAKYLNTRPISVFMVNGLLGVYEAGLEQSSSSLGRTMMYLGTKMQLLAVLEENRNSEVFPAYVAARMAKDMIESGRNLTAADELLQRVSPTALLVTRQSAAVSRASLLLKSGHPEDQNKALVMLRQVIAQQPTERQVFEYAYAALAEGLMQMKQWEELGAVTREYLEHQPFTSYRAKMSGYLGLAYDKRGLIEDAIGRYTGVFVNFTGEMEVSAPAVERLIQLTWQRNTPSKGKVPSDRQTAYHLGHRYLSVVEGTYVEGVLTSQAQKSLETIRQLVAKWEKSGEVVSVEQMLKEARQGKRPIP